LSGFRASSVVSQLHEVSVTHTGRWFTQSLQDSSERVVAVVASRLFRSAFISSTKLPESSHLEALQL
jgi:hypothetical protein